MASAFENKAHQCRRKHENGPAVVFILLQGQGFFWKQKLSGYVDFVDLIHDCVYIYRTFCTYVIFGHVSVSFRVLCICACTCM